ncbi:MAG: hypothetical protein LBH25_03915 [Fibromonadaceae bacterium]|nr:hypothetical protein [Fibromonadaceae bacterium]
MALAVLSCEQFGPQPRQQVAANAESGAERIEPVTEKFVEPTDLRIDLKKAQYFGRASEAIVFMGREWAERMDSADDDEKLKMAASYEKAQDDLIRKFGIRGKEEFKWIQAKALPDPVNKEVFARAGIWIKQ